MASTGLLVVSNIKQIGKSLRSIEKYVSSLYIHLNIPQAKAAAQPMAPAWGRLVSQLYVDNQSPTGMDMRILVGSLKGRSCSVLLKPVDMIFSDSHFPEVCESLRTQLNISSQTIYLEESATTDLNDFQDFDQAHKVYNTVVLGGTFDRIHVGHKIFLSQAVLRACRRLVVGVTTSAMTKSKVLPELILPVEQRIREVREFLMSIDSSVQYEVVPIDDPFGPTQNDPDIDLIVVSTETLRGGHKVNEIRTKKNLRPLEIFCIEVVECANADGPKESKVSSSNKRIDLLGARIRQPEPRPHLANEPYIIGLTGSIASGKSRMSQYFRDMGAVVMDCDKVAHEVYLPGQACFDQIVRHFGSEILSADGSIDRSKLGPIVFRNVQQLEALNAIVWPEIMAEVKCRIQALRVELQPKVVVIEAAVLLKAGWQTECHEVWSMIVPPEEAVRRIMERNGLSEEESRKRLDTQPTNAEIVSKSHVVFSSQWDADFTQKQAHRAWQMLMRELAGRRDTSSML